MAESAGKFGYTGNREIVPNNGRSSNQSERSHTNMSRAAYNDENYKVEIRSTEKHKAGGYVTRPGEVEYKQELDITSTVKYTDKVHGTTTEYQVETIDEEVVHRSAAKTSSSKRINHY